MTIDIIAGYAVGLSIAAACGYAFLSRKRENAAAWFLIMHGPLLVIILYLAFLAARIEIGHWPRPSVDDPDRIGSAGPFSFLFFVWIILVPVACFFPLIRAMMALFSKDAGRTQRIRQGLAACTLELLAIAFMRWDPNRVVKWITD